MKRVMGAVLGAMLLGSVSAYAEMRIWTSIKGDAIEAEYVSMFGGEVVLKRQAGSS